MDQRGGSMVDVLLCMHKAVGLTPSTTERERKREGGEREAKSYDPFPGNSSS